MDDSYDLDDRHAATTPTGATAVAPLPVLQAGGFGASVDAFACEPNLDENPPRMRLWLISLLGSQQAVKALWAHLVKGETATLISQDASAHFCDLAPEKPRGWRFFRASLPAASAYHGVLVPEMALFSMERPEFLLLPRRADEAAMLHYRFVNRRVTLPFHPSWADWLWERALRTGEAQALESWGLDAYRCVPDGAALAADLAEAIGQGALILTDEDVGSSTPTGLHLSPVEKITHGAT
jgi:hypothetical protein